MFPFIPRDLLILLKKLWSNFSTQRRKQLLFLIIFTVFGAFIDLLTIGMIFPFLAILTTPEIVFDYPIIKDILIFFNINDSSSLIFIITFLFIFFVFVSTIMRVAILYANTRLAYASGADLSIKVYENVLYQPYNFHISRNSSESISIILVKINNIINSVMLPIITAIGSFFVVISFCITITLVNPLVSISIFSCFLILYIIVSIISTKKLKYLGKVLSEQQNKITKSLHEGFGAIKDILLNNLQPIYVNKHRLTDYKLRKAQGNNVIIASTPRYIIESFGMISIAAVAYFLISLDFDSLFILQTLGLLAVSAQRLLPLLQQMYHTRTNIKAHKNNLKDVISLLDHRIPKCYNIKSLSGLKFEKFIEFDNVCFNYDEHTEILKSLSFKINKGSRVGLVGPTGSGKSTILDLLMGLLQPTDGHLFIDETKINNTNSLEWQRKIAHVPQNIYLSDSSISENIALGVEEKDINYDRIKLVSRAASLYDFIVSLPNGFNTIVGERGTKLSGGQRQRIAIARALYRDAEFLVFDEGTSSLDLETEKKVMESIENFNPLLTIVMVAHRLTTLKNCEKIIEIENGQIKAFLDYKTLNKN